MIDHSKGRRLHLAVGAAALVLALAACGTSGEPATTAPPAPSTVETSAPPAETPSAAAPRPTTRCLPTTR